MREIKFRAYEKAYNVIREVVSINFADKTVVLKDDFFDDVRLLNFNQVNLMQYTGLKDKNGKEIYGGYIVSVRYLYDKRTTDIAQVVWQEDKVGFGLKSLKGLTNEEYDLYRVTAEHNLEVIGNIYENPELLGRKNEK